MQREGEDGVVSKGGQSGRGGQRPTGRRAVSGSSSESKEKPHEDFRAG